MTTPLVLDCLDMALWTRRREGVAGFAGLTHHTDAGSVYTSIAFTDRLIDEGIDASVGSVGDAYDNSLAESQIGLYKSELIHHEGPWRDVDQVEAATASWVLWFNTQRTHGSIDDLTPLEVEQLDVNVVDAAARGAGEGLKLALNVGAMLLAFIALVALANGILGAGSSLVGLENPVTLERIMGVIFWPLAFAMGVPAAECAAVGELLGVKTILNEFVAYLKLAHMSEGLSRRSMIIVTYALCGFANLGSIGIQLGGIGGIAPERRSDLAKIGIRAMIAGTLAAFLTANIAGTLLG